jgi:hypothetical protein
VAVVVIGKLFNLATLVMNILDTKSRVVVVFHGLNPDDPARKISGFIEIIESASVDGLARFTAGKSGQVQGSSSYFEWLVIEAA